MTVVTDSPNPAFPRERPRVIVTRQLLATTEARMAELFDSSFNASDVPLTRDEMTAAMQSADVLVPTVTDRIDEQAIAAGGDRLRLIASYGAGTDHIDLHAARARGIIVTNTPGVLTDDTADLAMTLIMLASRRIAEGAALLRAGEWRGWAPSGLLGQALGGKRLAIIGMGRIGRAVARRARAFGMVVSYHNRHRLPDSVEHELGVHYAPELDQLLAEADIVSLHCPATAETRGLLDARRIALMKPTAIVINTARGELIDEDALVSALSTGRLAGAGLDVFTGEPKVDPRLLALPNLVALPHMGSATIEGREAAGQKVIANIRFWADGHRPPDQVLAGLV